MNIKEIIRRVAFSIISQPKQRVSVNIDTINYGGLLKKQNVIITGGSKGIGYAMAKKFVNEGARVLITGRNEDMLSKAVKCLGENALYIKYDNTDIYENNNFIESALKKMEKIDTLILNAGVSFHEVNFLNVTIDGFDLQFNTNLKANYFLAQSFLKYKLERKEGGNLLFLSSETAAKSIDIPYGLTKASINSLVGGLARRVYRQGIRVNAIAPGVTLTDMTGNKEIKENDYANNSASGRFLLPEEIAEVACFLISNASKCISGEIIYCDAGNHLKINGIDSEYPF